MNRAGLWMNGMFGGFLDRGLFVVGPQGGFAIWLGVLFTVSFIYMTLEK